MQKIIGCNFIFNFCLWTFYNRSHKQKNVMPNCEHWNRTGVESLFITNNMNRRDELEANSDKIKKEVGHKHIIDKVVFSISAFC